MPIYEYRCPACGHLFEEWVKHFDSPEQEPCPKCGKQASRIVSHTSFMLKGGGWYVTEYGNQKTRDHESGAGAPNEGHGDAKHAESEEKASEKTSSSSDSSSDASSQTTGQTAGQTAAGSESASKTAAA